LRHTFETSVGTVDVVVHEEARTVSASRLDAEGRTLGAAMVTWDSAELVDALTRQLRVPAAEADDIAARVKARHPRLRAIPPLVEQLPSRRGPMGLENAGVALRFVAVLLDAIIVFFPLAIVVGLLAGGGYSERGPGYANVGVAVEGNGALAFLIAALGYYVICESLTGRTLGKRMVRIRVVDEDGDHVGLGAALIRNVLRVIDGLFFYLVGALFALNSARGQRLGDRAAHTVVVRG
jgi:uncharacterized RDD family membrane protein YckC